MTDEELKAAALRAIEESSQSWICNGEDADGVAVVYSPSLGPCREIVHIAETAPAFGPYIAAANPSRILKLLAEQEEARTETGRLRAENIVLLKEAELLLDAVARLRKEVDAATAEVTRLRADREQMEEIEPGLYLMRGIKSAFSGIERRVGTNITPTDKEKP